jgi:hypothetical protein
MICFWILLFFFRENGHLHQRRVCHGQQGPIIPNKVIKRKPYNNGEKVRTLFITYHFKYPDLPPIFNRNWIYKKYTVERNLAHKEWDHIASKIQWVGFSICHNDGMVDLSFNTEGHKFVEEHIAWIKTS